MFKNNPSTYSIQTRNEGDSSRYFVLKIERQGREPEIHTSKSESYLNRYIPRGAVQKFL